MKSSLTSVTFRNKTVDRIVYLARSAQLDAIEWGGDIHVPVGDKAAAEAARKLCRENGLEVSAYGSYFYAGIDNNFADVLETAQRLECPVIRVWAGKTGSLEATAEQRRQCTDALAEAVCMAERVGCTVATEYHGWSLTDSVVSAKQLLRDVPGLKTFWQPPSLPVEENLSAMEQLKGLVQNIHVFQWVEGKRRPLEEGTDVWVRYLQQAKKTGVPGYATLEFVKGDSEDQFMDDVRVLREMLSLIG